MRSTVRRPGDVPRGGGISLEHRLGLERRNPGNGLLADTTSERTSITKPRRGSASSTPHLDSRSSRSAGVWAVAPAEEGRFDTTPPRRTAERRYPPPRPGSRLYLPVLVPGAPLLVRRLSCGAGGRRGERIGIESPMTVSCASGCRSRDTSPSSSSPPRPQAAEPRRRAGTFATTRMGRISRARRPRSARCSTTSSTSTSDAPAGVLPVRRRRRPEDQRGRERAELGRVGLTCRRRVQVAGVATGELPGSGTRLDDVRTCSPAALDARQISSPSSTAWRAASGRRVAGLEDTRQPDPADAAADVAAPLRNGHRAAAPACTMARRPVRASRSRDLTILPRYSHGDPSEMWRTTRVGAMKRRSPAARPQGLPEVDDLPWDRTRRERRRARPRRSAAAGVRPRADADPLALATRELLWVPL